MTSLQPPENIACSSLPLTGMAANIYDTGGRAAASNGVSPVSRTASSAIRNIWTIGRRGLGMTFTSLGTKLGRRPHGTPPDFHTASQSCFLFTVSGWGLAGYWILGQSILCLHRKSVV